MNPQCTICKYCLCLAISVLAGGHVLAADTIPIQVEHSVEGAPLTLGIPFAQGDLFCPDYTRLLDADGHEIPCQTTQVTTWEPLDYSVKWLWVFFFATNENRYFLEYGPGVRKAPITGDRIVIKNAQRKGQRSIVQTGPLRFSVSKKAGGFIDDVLLDVDGDGFDAEDTIAVCNHGRGSFLDLFDDLGLDASTATVHRTIRERGSGPLHAILRLEGTYTYHREDNRPSPFVIRLHVYAGKSYVRVLHTLTYTGVPDKHIPVEGDHACIALADSEQIKDDSKTEDEGWTLPDDRIAATGLCLEYNLAGPVMYQTGYREGTWAHPKPSKTFRQHLEASQVASVFQTGPKPDRIPPVPNSTTHERISGFEASIRADDGVKKQIERAEGWADLSDDRWGIAIGIKNFLEEYPKEIAYHGAKKEAVAFLWSPQAEPLSFARHSLERDQGMIANFAEGVTKTSEVVFYFHKGDAQVADIKKNVAYFLDAPVPHASPAVYANSQVYGRFAPRLDHHPAFERSLDYKFDWEIFNQHWEPWYGMFDYGDQKNVFFREDWHRWQNNEPAIDFMYWLQFIRTGDAKYYRAAEAMSRHTMDVDNVHWPADPPYYGDTNESLDFWKHQSGTSQATPYLGIGRRHARQHWSALLSAHVWLQGWIASYYLTGYHRGLDVARLTADAHLRRIWGDHGLTGRRLYLSVWNLVEAWDATKDPAYLADLQDRVDRMLHFQNGPNQCDDLVMDRYGYSQIYASHGLYKYYQLTGEERLRQSLLRHARAVRDNPPYNHDYESYLSTIHSLVIGHELSGDVDFLREAKHRARWLKTKLLTEPFEKLGTQGNIAEALERVSHLPTKGYFATQERWVSNWGPTQGLRVFGWTHIYNIPWLLHAIEADEEQR